MPMRPVDAARRPPRRDARRDALTFICVLLSSTFSVTTPVKRRLGVSEALFRRGGCEVVRELLRGLALDFGRHGFEVRLADDWVFHEECLEGVEEHWR